MRISMSKTREQFPLSIKKVLKKTVSSTLAISILLLIIGVATAVAIGVSGKGNFGILSLIILGVLILIAIITTIAYIYQKWYYSVYFYDLTDDFIIIKKGPITPREITIPYERVQDIYVDQDLLDRIFGLYDVHLSSATISSGSEAHIDGVERQAADGLRELLLRTVQQKITKYRKNINNNQIDQQ
jgi:membrane protein YdbS with pleckstrin-like domain